jgi:DNA-binding transcriptional MerR regulator
MAANLYSMQQLEAATGVTMRTLRQWIRLRLLPKPVGRGRGARYDQRHLVRAQVVLALRTKREPLRQIRQRIAELSEEQLGALVPAKPRATDATGVPIAPPEPSYPSNKWEVVYLMDGLTLMVSGDRGPLPRRVADEIYRHYAMPSMRGVR